MAQGKLKVKSKLPDKVKQKSKQKNKGTSATKRANRPIQPKKKKLADAHKLKQTITKTVNKAAEEDIRALASSSSEKKLSKAQQAVAEHNKKPKK